MHTNPTWKDWFVFSKKERHAFIALLCFLIFFCLLLIFYQPPALTTNIEKKADEILSKNQPDNNLSSDSFATTNTNEAVEAVKLFAFDPNVLDAAGFKQLGLRDKTIRTILNYRNKGGHFYKPDDLKKIYGLREEEAARLIPYVQIRASEQKIFEKANDNASHPAVYKKPLPQKININTATAEQWMLLPAIGEVLSHRIVKFRDKMGGFTSVEQVRKTYGLTDSAYQAILPYLSFSESTTVPNIFSAAPKININTASLSDLKNNASISPEAAEAIIIYRKQHGNYKSVEDIKNIVFINNELYQKLAPLFTVQ